MKIAINISVLCIAALLTSCIKDNSGNQPLMVKDVIIAGNACEIFYTYDANNRCSSIIQCDTVETFTYSHDSVLDVKMSAGALTYRNIYPLNSAGLATGYISLGQSGLLAKYSFTYDASGHRLSARDSTITNTIDSCTIQSNDVVLEVSTSTAIPNNNYSISTNFYSGTINRLSNANFGLTFLGTSSANLKKVDTINSQQGQYTVNYTYTLNNTNGIAQQVSTVNGVVVDSRHFDYY
jgi:hypothetical protein